MVRPSTRSQSRIVGTSSKNYKRKNERLPMTAQERVAHEENVAGLRRYIEDRWARGISRDYSSPDLWGDRLK